jgi:hypothetical protein
MSMKDDVGTDAPNVAGQEALALDKWSGTCVIARSGERHA